MKLLVVSVLIQAAFRAVMSSPSSSIGLSNANSLSDILSELEKQRAANEDLKDKQVSGERGGRILATYSQQTAKNTAAIVQKLDNLTSSFTAVATEIQDLQKSLNQSNAQIIAKLGDVNSALTNGSDLVKSLDQVAQTLLYVLLALSDSTDNSTLLGQIAALNALLTDKLTSIEKIVGYDDYPSAPSNTFATGR